MKRLMILLVGLLFYMQQLFAQIIVKEPLSPRITGYKIDTELNTTDKTIAGTMQAFWVNKSNDVVPDIQLHMYMNAFRSNKSTVRSESVFLQTTRMSDNGWINIKSFTDKYGTDLMPAMQYISPDDGNINDSTVLRILLPKAALPGDTVFINVKFETKLPGKIRRTGYSDDFYFVGQWFPKFGVYEPAGMRYAVKGGWNCHQFHENSEFYSNHSVYDVNITVPKEYVVGTGGMFIKEVDNAEKKRLTYRAEDIVDFAWTAWPGYAVFTDQWEHVKITLLIPKDRTNQVARQFTAVKHALEYLTKNVGPFPWPYLTFVDPPAKGSGSGGMEYTTLFTSESAYKMPISVHMPEMVTVHEFGHAYFMGILASNEFEEPWLDEGVNSFIEERIMDHYYGENSGMIDFPFLKVSDKTVARISYVHMDGRQVTSNNEYSWNYPHNTYGTMSYNKAALCLYTMMGIIGEETTNEVFREYYKQWAFKHPSGKDFINVVNEVVKREYGDKFGHDMNWFFDQTLYGTGICDYKVSGLQNTDLHLDDDKPVKNDSVDNNPSSRIHTYKSVAELERIGDVMLPVDVLIHFDNGDEVLESWDGKSRYKDFEYTGSRKIDWVKIDPEYKIRMDVNFINNSLAEVSNKVPVRRFTNKFTSFMQFFISIVTL